MRRSTRLKQRTIIIFILLVIGGSLFVAGSTSHAVTTFSIESIGAQVGLPGGDLKQIIINVIRWVLGIVTLAAVGYMIYGGILWMTSAGNEQRIEKAKQVILQAAIGLVIILLAWAIVFFVVRTFTNVTTNSSGGPTCSTPPCGCGLHCPSTNDTFDITAVTSCAEAPNYSKEVPRSSGISFTFNSDLEASSVQDAFDHGRLRITKCSSTAAGYDCGTAVPATATTPKEIEPQSFTPGNKPIGVAGATRAEWVARDNTLTFYHLSFSDDPASADNRWFESQTSPTPQVAYRITIPRQDPGPAASPNPDALTDRHAASPRRLVHCQRPGPSPIIGDAFIGEHCIETADQITWEFTTGTDTVGQPLAVMSTTPSSDYLTDDTLTPARNIPRNPTLGINFDGGLDPATVDMDNFEILPFTTPPTPAGNWTDGTTAAALPAGDFNIRMNGTGTGVWVQYKQTASCAASLCSDGTRRGLSCTTDNDCPQQRLFEPFTWYKIVARDFRNLCGTLMQPPTKSWVFETNDVTPGVAQVYPNDGFEFACPTTRVFVQFNTSMWDITENSSQCVLHAPSNFNLQGELDDAVGNEVTSRTFTLMDPVPLTDPDPNKWCKNYEFRPNTAGLPTGDYHGGITSTMLMDSAGTMLTSGDQPPLSAPPTDGKGWGFSVKPPDQCYQPPLVSSVSPGHDVNGACVSVIGDYFVDPAYPPPATTYPRANDRLTLGARTQTVSPTAWQSSSIVSLVSDVGLTAGNTYDYQVTVDYPVPIGALSSQTHANSKFTLDAGPASSNRPCLLSVNPNQGAPNQTGISATGKRFGTKTGAAAFMSSNPGVPESWSSGDWTDTSIADITVNPGARPNETAQVQVRNSVGRLSNELPFRVLAPIVPVTGVPTVVFSNLCNIPASQVPSPNPFQDLAHTSIDNEACINTSPTVQFTLDINPASMSGMTLWQCPGGACNALPANQVPGVASAIGTQVKFTPASNLTPDMLYEVRMTNAMQATVAAGGQAIVPYNWQFRTRAGAECPIDGVTLSPTGPILERNATFAHGLSANTVDNACHTLTHNGVDFDWTQAPSPSTTASLQLPSPPHRGDTNVIVPAAATPVPGSIDVRVGAQSKNSSILRFTYDPTACTESSQCTTNALGESCGTPACINGYCEPVLNQLDHDRGAEGNMITIKGCWFGAYGPQSKVKFAPDLDGQVPDLAICGPNTWGNERIYRQVPTGVQTGDVTVVRDDAVISNARPYTQTADLFPGLCQINPNFGLTGDNAILHGFSLGTKAATDVVNLRQTAAPNNSVDATDYPSPALPIDWADQLITFKVPDATSIGFNDVKVKKATADSNSVLYNALSVLPQSCSQWCTFDAVGDAACAAATPGTACSYPGPNLLGCCAPRPVITSFKPEQNATNICRNTVAQITFDRPLDQSTVTAGSTGTVQYQDGINIVNGSVGYRTTATNEGEITYYPGLLRAGPQTMSLARYIPSPLPSTFDLLNPSFETVDANGLPTDWGTGNGVTTQADPAPNLSGHSILADCSAASCTQAYAAQTQLTPDPQGTTYRVTAWVRTEQTNGVKAGLITACMGSNPAENWSNCGYDPEKSGGTHPGMFTQSTGVWKRIDLIITKTTNDNRRLHIDCYANTRAKVWCDDITVTKVVPTPQATEIRGANGVLADTTRAPLRFTTGSSICTVDRVGVEEADTLLTAANQVASLEANAYSNAQSAPITPVDGLYAWNWSWGSQTPAVARTVMSSAAPDNPSQANVTALANGTTTVTATAKIGLDKILTPSTKDRTIDGQANVRVAFCVDPWRLDPNDPSSPAGFTDSMSNCDLRNGPGQCENYNFSMSYCRDTGGAPLPNFNYTGSSGSGLGSIEGLNETDPKRLKTFFFKESATSRDTIGLLIFKNDEILSPYDWFKQRFPLDTSGSSTVIGGYPAVKSGTTTYIGVTNYRRPFLAPLASLEGLMFVFDYNSNNASPQTVQIANQMIDTMVLNTNLSLSYRSQLIRDTDRRQDLTSMKLLLDAYRTKNGAYPTLTGGSYIPGFTTSKWPSWQTTLGSELAATIPSDPVNTFGYPTNTDCANPPDATYEASTCWSETKKQFTCPSGLTFPFKKSQIYGYRYSADSVNLYANMEFNLLGATFISPPPPGICAAPNGCDCFNFYLPVTP